MPNICKTRRGTRKNSSEFNSIMDFTLLLWPKWSTVPQMKWILILQTLLLSRIGKTCLMTKRKLIFPQRIYVLFCLHVVLKAKLFFLSFSKLSRFEGHTPSTAKQNELKSRNFVFVINQNTGFKGIAFSYEYIIARVSHQGKNIFHPYTVWHLIPCWSTLSIKLYFVVSIDVHAKQSNQLFMR